MPQCLQWYIRDDLQGRGNGGGISAAMHGNSAAQFMKGTVQIHHSGSQDDAGLGGGFMQSLVALSAAPVALAAGAQLEVRRVAAGAALFVTGVALPGFFRLHAARTLISRTRP